MVRHSTLRLAKIANALSNIVVLPPGASPTIDIPPQMTKPTQWLVAVSESKTNYWATYVVDLTILVFCLAWDATRFGVGPLAVVALFPLGIFVWTLTEYSFHRWFYHMGLAVTREGHEKHHEDPTAYIAMPWFVTPILFLPPQQIVGNWLGVPGFSTFLAGWFGGFIAYSFMHHSLHHYKLKFAWFRHLQSQHRIHHAMPETNFGVTMRFWDRVFGTEFTKVAPK
jgi:sterol desaturase/sphingolipid hydroxylase (fatty acid hydroxylase superfamily)